MKNRLVRDKVNVFGNLIHYYPGIITALEIEGKIQDVITDLNLHFKDFTIGPPAPGSYISSNSRKLTLVNGVHEVEEFIINIRQLGISMDGFYMDVEFPEIFYKTETFEEMKDISKKFTKHIDALMNDVEKYLVEFSGSTKLPYQRSVSNVFSAKIHFDEAMTSFLSEKMQGFVGSITKGTHPVIEDIPNLAFLNLGINVINEDFDQEGKLALDILKKKENPITTIPRRSQITCESSIDYRQQNYVFRIRDVPYERCWSLIVDLVE